MYILEKCENKVNKKIITNELINNFKFYLYEEERSGNTIEKYMRDIQFSVSGYKAETLINRLLSNTKKSCAKDMRRKAKSSA